MITTLPNILIVDDIEVNLILLETALRKESAKLYRATSGQEALQYTAQHEFALIILDVSMPVMSGFELATLIRKQSLNPLTPIIFISAILFDEFSISQGYRSGAVDYLSKPYHHEILLSKVRVFLQLHTQKQQLLQQSIVLQESNNLYKEVLETLNLKLQLEKAVSLASARFSGNFELNNSIHFMLRDIANVCGSDSATFIPSNKVMPVGYTEGSLSTKNSIAVTSALKTKLNKAFVNNNETDVLISHSDIKGPWILPASRDSYTPAPNGLQTNPATHTPETDNLQSNPATIAVKVASGEKHFGHIIIHNCTGISGWENSELNALSVFGTITGNALERNATRQDLIDSELRYRSYIENAPEGIVITSNSGDIQEYNQAFADVFYDLLPKGKSLNILKILNKQILSGTDQELSNLLNGKLSRCEFTVTIQGKSIVIKAQSVKLPAKQYLIFCTDISNERDIEKHLIQTERMVAIGEMATGIAHEINQPLNTISFGIDNLFQALKSNKADPTYIKDKSDKIFDGIHRMRNIIDHVRNFARGNDDVILSSFVVTEPVNNALSLFTEQLRNHGIEVVKNFSENAANAFIHGNTYKIEQVLLNLFSNSRDSMEEKKLLNGIDYHPKLTIAGEVINSRLILTVSDNGSGMSDDQLKNVTKPFFTSKAPGKGTGLGLAISHNIISEHNGVLTFSSLQSEGTSVRIELPVLLKESSQAISV